MVEPPHSLTDDVIELRLIRILEQGDVSARSPQTQFLAQATEFRYAIHRIADGARVGRIHIRITNDKELLRILGHCGYAVDESERRKGYAWRALGLIVSIARQLSIAPLWVLIEPANLASRRAVERAGFRLHDEIDAEPEALALGHGPRLCRYVIDQP